MSRSANRSNGTPRACASFSQYPISRVTARGVEAIPQFMMVELITRQALAMTTRGVR